MKILYKVFLFCLIIRLIPIVIYSMGIFPNTTLTGLGTYDFTEKRDLLGILSEIVSPNPITIGDIYGPLDYVPFIRDISISFSLYAIIGVLGVIILLRSSSTLPSAIGIMIAAMIVPFIVEVGSVFVKETESYHSTSLTTMMIAILVGIIAVGLLTILEMAKGTDQDVSE